MKYARFRRKFRIFHPITRPMKCSLQGIIAALICLSAFRLFAQQSTGNTQYYTFEYNTVTYGPLDSTKTTSVNNGSVWVEDDIDTIPIGFKFHFLDHDLTWLQSNQVNLFFPQRSYYITPYGNFLIRDRAWNTNDTNTDISPISYLLDSSQGQANKILKIQWKNAGFFFDSLDVMYLNLQIWLYEGSNNIEIRYGKSNVDLRLSQVGGCGARGCGPFIGLAKLDSNTGVEKYELDLYGDALAPATKSLNDTGARHLDEGPPDGMLYRFVYHDSEKIKTPVSFAIYPVPTRDFLHFNLVETAPAYITVTNLLGHILLDRKKLIDNELDISSLPSGMYYVTVYQNTRIDNQKVILIR